MIEDDVPYEYDDINFDTSQKSREFQNQNDPTAVGVQQFYCGHTISEPRILLKKVTYFQAPQANLALIAGTDERNTKEQIDELKYLASA